MNAVIEAIRSRRSIRAYQDRKLAKKELEAIVEAGTWAPTGHNEQPWHFSVVQDRGLIAKVNGRAKAAMARYDTEWIRTLGDDPDTDITRGAPVLVIVSSRSQTVSGPIGCAAAMQNMMGAAQSMGIGSCWMGFAGFAFKDEALMAALGVPAGYRPQQAAVFGFPSGSAVQTPARRSGVSTYIGQF